MKRIVGGIVFVVAVVCLTVASSWKSYRMENTELDGAPIKIEFPQLRLLEQWTMPTDQDWRLIFVGDVHGQYTELMNIVEGELGGLDDQTTLVLLGDVVSKGPDSGRVIQFILEYRDRVKCVLGNHDLAVLFALVNPELSNHHNLLPLRVGDSQFIPKDLSKVKKMHQQLAHELGFVKAKSWALHSSLAVQFTLPNGQILYGCHAGMLPGDFSQRTPSVHALTEMKFVDPKDWTHTSKEKFKNSKHWYKLWDDVSEHITVLYGHDAKRGLNLRSHTKGLDSGCVKGKELSALQYSYDHITGKITTKLFQTSCVNNQAK